MKNRIYKIIFTTLLLLSGVLLKAQVDNLHYIPPFFAPPYINSSDRYVDVGPTTDPSGNYFHRVVLSTSVEDTFEVNIRTKTDFVATVTISKATPGYVDLPTYPYYNAANNITYQLPKTVVGYTALNTALSDQGLILEANFDFYVNISQRSSAQGDILTSKGRVGKGTHFFSGHIPNKVLTNSGYRARRSNFVSVMATEDNTQVTFYNPRIKWNGQAQNTFTITLQKEETYVLGAWLSQGYALSDNPDDFNGTEITSTKDIVVNSGSWCGSNTDGNKQDMGFDQLVPVDILGTEFIAVKGEGSDATNHAENIIVVSPFDNNTIVINGGESQVTLDKGEYHLFTADDYSLNQNIFLNSTYGTYVYQSLLGYNDGSNNNQTVGFIFIPKLSCEGYKDVSISYINSIGTPQLLLVARKGLSGEIPVVTIDGIKIDSALSISGDAVTGNSDWLTYKLSESNIANHFNDDGDWNVTIESNYAINAALSFRSGVIGGGGYYSGFGSRPSISTAPRILNTNGCAPGNMELVADDNYYATYQWYKDGIEIPGETNSVFYPATRGIYSLKGLTDCGLSRESTPVDVKTCIFWESKDGDGMDVEVWEDPTALSPPEDPFVFLEFTLAEALDFDIFIRYKTVVPSYITYPATPGIGGDFIPIDYNAQIHIPADSLTGYTDPMWILPDFLDEENEDFGIEIIDVLDVDGNLGAVVQDDQVLVTILDDDSITTTVNVEDDFAVVENEGNAFFTISLSEASGRSVFIDYKTVANTAFSSNDYYTRSGTVTFLEGEMEKVISVPIINRPGFNGVRDFFLVLENETYCLLGNDTSTCTIVDKEGEDVFLYYVNDTSATEGYPLYFNIQLTQQLLEPLSFRLALLEGTASEDDFDNNAIDNTTLTADVSVLDASKTQVNGLSFNEGVGDGILYLQLSNIMDVPVTVMYKTTNNTAEEHVDYEPINNMIIFMPGDSIKQLAIPIVDDIRKEPNENFNFQITKVVNGYNSQNIWEVYIVDNDPLPIISLETDKSVLEDEGSAAFKVYLSNKSNDTINVTYSVYEYDINPEAAWGGDGTQPHNDFRPITTQRLTFSPGDSIKYINAEVFLNDAAAGFLSYNDESPEKFYVQLVNVEDATTASINVTAQKSVATIHEELVQTGINKRYVYLEGDESITEGDDFTFTLKRFTGNLNAWRVQVALVHNNTSAADFTSTPTTAYIDIAGANLAQDITFSTSNDILVEPDENFTLEIVSAQYKVNAADSWTAMDLLPNRSTVYGTIFDNDILDAPQLRPDTFYLGTNQALSIVAEHGVLENDIIYSTNSTNSIIWTDLMISGYGTRSTLAADGSFTYTPALDYEGTFSMDYTVTTTKGNSVSSSVYFEVTKMPKRYYIFPGDTVYNLEVPTIDDALEEGDEQFTMTAFDLSSTSVRILPGRNVSTGTIIDDDFYPIVTDDYFYVNEDNALYPPTANVRDNDIISDMDTLTEIVLDTTGVYLQHGTFIVDMSLDGTFTYMPDPRFSGRDSFLYTVRDSRTDSVYSPAQSYDHATAVVIIDIIPTNDFPIAVDDAYTMDEDDSGTQFELTNNDIDPDGVGLSISEIWGNSLGSVQISSDSTIIYDPIAFGKDTLFYRLDDLDSYDDPDTGMVIITIIGEDDRSFTILRDENILETNATPSGVMTFTVTLSNTSYKTRTVAYRTLAVSGNSAAGTDFISSSGTLTFSPGTTQQTTDITVMGRGTLDNYDHRFIFELYAPSVGTYLGTNKTANGSIINVEPGIRYLVIENDVTVNEGDTAIFTVSLVGDPLLYNLPFSATTSDGTAIGSIDYEDSTFVAGSSFVIPELTMSSASGSYSVNEGANNITIDFDLSQATTADVSFSYKIHNAGTATAINEADYIADERFVNIPAGQTSHSITIPILEDELDEDDETFFIDLDNPINVSITNSNETVTIIDNDDSPNIILGGDKSVFETEGTLQYPVRLSRISGKTITVRLRTDENGTADDDGNRSDYNYTDQTLTFAPGDSILYFNVTIRNNNDGPNGANAPETFRVYATNALNASIATPIDATIYIYDSEAEVIVIEQDIIIDNANNTNINFNILSLYPDQTRIGGRGGQRTNNSMFFKLSISGDDANLLQYSTDYGTINNNEWFVSTSNTRTISFTTKNNISQIETSQFEIEITDAVYADGNDPDNFTRIDDIEIVNNRKSATATVLNEMTERYVQSSSFVIHPGETLNSNFLDNNNMNNFNISGINFIEITSAYWPYDHEDNLTLGTDGSLSYTPPVHAQNGTEFLGEFKFVAQIQGNDPTDNNAYHEYNDTVIIYVEEEAQVASNGSNLPMGSGTTSQLKVPTINDNVDEADEDFYITLDLVDTSVVKLRTRTTARGVILDNDIPPVGLLQPDLVSTYERQTITVNVLTNDDASSLYNFSLTGVANPTNGTIVSYNANGDVTYISNQYFTGADQFTYTATSDQGVSYPMNISVSVESVENIENKRSLYCPNNTSNLSYTMASSFDANTFEVWIKPVGSASGGIANLGGGKTISRNGSGNIVLGGFTGTVFIDGIAGNTLADDKWQHLLITNNTAFNVSAVIIGFNGTNGMQAYYDELRIWNKPIISQSSVEQIMFQELYYLNSTGQLKSLITDANLFNPAYAGWGNLLFHAKFNSTDFWDVIGWSSVSINGTAAVSMDLPFNHYLSTAINNNWHWTGNWHFGKDYPDVLSPEYIILQSANGNNPYLHQGSSYSINSETSIKNLMILQNADFTMEKGAIRITGNIFRSPNDRVVFMNGSSGVKITKSINISY